MTLLNIENLHAIVDSKTILNDLTLNIAEGEVHAIMGPNGSGKSTLANILAGRPGYEVVSGTIRFRGEDLLAQEAETRAQNGMFLAFQYPVEIPGVSNMEFLKASMDSLDLAHDIPQKSTVDFMRATRDVAKQLDLNPEFLKRGVNEGFSGGEKKRNEILQMALLEPIVSILDETDSGLDIDALRVVANGVNQLANSNTGTLLITHYQRLLNEIEPDFVHVMSAGKIIKTGGKDLALDLEKSGYDWLDKVPLLKEGG